MEALFLLGVFIFSYVYMRCLGLFDDLIQRRKIIKEIHKRRKENE
jgi:hypothetical protein